MTFHITPMTPEAAQAIDQWRYPGIYAFYDLDQDVEDRDAFLDPNHWENRVYAVLNENEEIVGFFSFEQEKDVITLGLGLHPEYTGKGFGESFVLAGLDFGNRVFQPARFQLSVAAFNQRAIRVYERLGFVVETIFKQQTNGGEYDFVQMSRLAPCESKTPPS